MSFIYIFIIIATIEFYFYSGGVGILANFTRLLYKFFLDYLMH